MKLVADYAALDLSAQENKNRKIQLVIENDRLKVEVGELTKQLDEAIDLSSSSGSGIEVSNKPVFSKKPPSRSLSYLRMASLEAGGPSKTSSTPNKVIVSPNPPTAAYGDIGGVKLFSSPPRT